MHMLIMQNNNKEVSCVALPSGKHKTQVWKMLLTIWMCRSPSGRGCKILPHDAKRGIARGRRGGDWRLPRMRRNAAIGKERGLHCHSLQCSAVMYFPSIFASSSKPCGRLIGALQQLPTWTCQEAWSEVSPSFKIIDCAAFPRRSVLNEFKPSRMLSYYGIW